MTASRRGVLMGALVAGLAGCTSTQPDTSPSPTSAAPTPTPSAVPSPSPSSSPTPVPRATLTGMTVTDPATLTRPAVAVKVPNLKVEQPQVGLNAADIVICQPNGDSATRLCPIFHSQYPDAVGPVRSIRPADVALLSPIFPLFANTGAADWVMNYVKANSEHLERMTYLDYRGTAAYSVDKSRLYKANGKTQYDRAIQAHPAGMASLAEKAGAPGAYLTFALDATTSSAVAGTPATSVQIPYGKGHKYDMSYTFDAASKRYLRSQPWGEHILADGARVDADNVLIVKAEWDYDKIWEGSGAADPVIDLIDAEGDFIYLNGGLSVTGTWTKGAAETPFVFTTADGKPLALAPGRTWIELPRPTADILIA